MRERATRRRKITSNTGAERAWRFLKRNPDNAAEREAAAEALAPAEAGPFPMRTLSPGDRAAAAWGLMAWEDPRAEDWPEFPFWTEAPALRGLPVPGAPPLTELLAGPGVRLSGLRLEDPGAVVKVEQGEASLQIRIEDGQEFDPARGTLRWERPAGPAVIRAAYREERKKVLAPRCARHHVQNGPS